jgi:hypothetical protein
MGTTLDKTITRNSGNTVAIDTSYSELNTKASGLVNDIVSHVETQLATTETALQTAEGLVDTKIASLLSVGDTGYTKDVVDVNLANQINALAPYSGYTQVSKKLDNFVFKEDANFTYSVADKNRFIKFGNEVVDTYGPELVTTLGTIAYSGCSISNQSFNSFTVDATTTASASFYLVVEDGKTYTLNFYSSVATKVSVRNSTEDLVATTSKNKGLISVTFTAKTTTARLYMARDVSIGTYTFDNISVKEIQTANFEATRPQVTEIITDGSNSTSGAVAKGEYVLDGTGELISGTTNTSNASNWIPVNDAIISSDGTTLSVQANVTNYPYARMILDSICEEGVEYIISGVLSGTNPSLRIYNKGEITSTGSFTFVAGATTWLDCYMYHYNDTAMAYFSNISVKRVSDVFRAKRDIEAGTNLLTGDYSSDIDYSVGDIVNWTDGNQYRMYADAGAGTPPDWTSYWIPDSIWEDRTQIGVTHQSLAYHAYNTITSAYEGIKTEILLTDTYAGDTTKEVMLANGFSEVSEFLYSKGSYLCLPVGLAQMLNSGSYDPFSNNAGTATRDFGTGYVDWYEYPIRAENVSKLFAYNSIDGYIYSSYGSIGGNALRNTHPQSKFYDIIYADQFKDLREYAKIANKYEIELLREDKRVNSCVDEVSMTKLNDTIASATDGSPYILLYTTERHANNDNIVVFGNDGTMYNNSNSVVRIAQNGANTATYVYIEVANTSNFTVGASFEVYYLDKTNPIISSNTKLSIDLIGSPDNYPDVVKTRLASGVGINGVYPLLVGQDGSDYTDNTAAIYPVASNKTVESFVNGGLFYGDSGYAVATFNTNNTDNNCWLNWANNNGRKVAIHSYTSNNAPYQQTDPKPVLEVTPKAIASNSHSIYKGGDIASQVSGKIATGSSDGGYESKVLENVHKIGYDFKDTDYYGTTVSLTAYNEIMYCTGANTTGVVGGYYTRTEDYAFIDPDDTNLSGDWELVAIEGITIPQHPTLSLNTDDSSASKWFEVLEEDENGNVYAGVYGEEMVYDTTFGDGDDFEQLTNGTDIDLNGNTVKTFHGSNPLNIKMK